MQIVNMANKFKISNGVLVFLYIRLFIGLTMMFYPLDITEWIKNVIIVIGGLVVLTSGIEVKFNHLFKSVKK